MGIENAMPVHKERSIMKEVLSFAINGVGLEDIRLNQTSQAYSMHCTFSLKGELGKSWSESRIPIALRRMGYGVATSDSSCISLARRTCGFVQ